MKQIWNILGLIHGVNSENKWMNYLVGLCVEKKEPPGTYYPVLTFMFLFIFLPAIALHNLIFCQQIFLWFFFSLHYRCPDPQSYSTFYIPSTRMVRYPSCLLNYSGISQQSKNWKIVLFILKIFLIHNKRNLGLKKTETEVMCDMYCASDARNSLGMNTKMPNF